MKTPNQQQELIAEDSYLTEIRDQFRIALLDVGINLPLDLFESKLTQLIRDNHTTITGRYQNILDQSLIEVAAEFSLSKTKGVIQESSSLRRDIKKK